MLHVRIILVGVQKHGIDSAFPSPPRCQNCGHACTLQPTRNEWAWLISTCASTLCDAHAETRQDTVTDSYSLDVFDQSCALVYGSSGNAMCVTAGSCPVPIFSQPWGWWEQRVICCSAVICATLGMLLTQPHHLRGRGVIIAACSTYARHSSVTYDSFDCNLTFHA